MSKYVVLCLPQHYELFRTIVAPNITIEVCPYIDVKDMAYLIDAETFKSSISLATEQAEPGEGEE